MLLLHLAVTKASAAACIPIRKAAGPTTWKGATLGVLTERQKDTKKIYSSSGT